MQIKNPKELPSSVLRGW